MIWLVIEAAKVPNATLFGQQRNPARRWWQLWRPRWIVMTEAECAELMR